MAPGGGLEKDNARFKAPSGCQEKKQACVRQNLSAYNRFSIGCGELMSVGMQGVSHTNGYFSGYASIFGVPDKGGDVVMPGAFKRSLEKPGRTKVQLLFQHDPKEPVGKILNVVEDSIGLKVEGLLFPQVERAKSLIALVSGGAIDGLSIGFRTLKAVHNRTSGHRHLHQIDLWEISIVTFPMMERARIFPVSNQSDNPVRQYRSPQNSIAAAISLLSNQ